MKIYRVRIYNDADKVIDSWLVELPYGDCVPSGLMREIEYKYPGLDWSLTKLRYAPNTPRA